MKGLRSLATRVNLRHLRAKKVRTALTVGGIAAGVALLFSISIINATLLSSFRSSIRDLAGAAELEVAATDATGLPEDLVATVEDIEGVEAAVPVLRTTTRLEGDGGDARVLVLGITPAFTQLFPKAAGPLGEVGISGDFGSEGGGLLVGASLADDIGATRGTAARLQVPEGDRQVAVTGEISSGALALLNGGDVAFMLLEPAQELFGKRDRIDSVYVVGDPDVELDAVRSSIEERLEGSALVGPPGTRGQGLERVFASLATLLSMGGTVALFVALFVVYNTMSMSLAERRREISMIMALGGERRQMFGAFLLEAGALGVVASLLGLGGGLWLADALVARAADDFRILSITSVATVTVPASAVVVAGLGGLAVSLVGAYVPARRVFTVAPMESLRPVAAYEWEPRSGSWSSGRMLAVGVAAIAGSIATLVAFLLFPEERWIVTVGLLLGLSGVTLLLPRIVPAAIALVRPVLVRGFSTTGRLSSDALVKNPGRSTFTVAALVLTLGLVVGVAGALDSYERQIENTATALIGAPIYVTAESFTGLTSDQPLELSLRDELEAVEGVDYVYPLRFALLDLGSEQALIYAIPVEEALERGANTQLGSITSDPDGFLKGLEDGGVAVSRLTAERLELEVGEEVRLPTPSGERDFEVHAVFDDLLSFDSFYLDLAEYHELWGDDKADEFGVLTERGSSVAAVKRGLEEAVARAEAPAEVFGKDELVGRILAVVAGTFELAQGVQLAALVVAALTIANTMFTAVLERRWEMGLERAIGMGSAQLARTVLLEAAVIGAIGGAGGAILGAITGFFMTQAMEAEFSWQIPYRLPLLLAFVSVAGSTVLAALAGVVPSRLAVRTPIIESLRYE